MMIWDERRTLTRLMALDMALAEGKKPKRCRRM